MKYDRHLKTTAEYVATIPEIIHNQSFENKWDSESRVTDSYENFFSAINEHIFLNYGIVELTFSEESLEYSDFIQPGCKLQFLSLRNSIRICIFFPPAITREKIEKKIYDNYREYYKLPKLFEFALKSVGNYVYVKYNFKKDLPVYYWGPDTISEFKIILDKLIVIVFKS
jgi:hypothetical protein